MKYILVDFFDTIVHRKLSVEILKHKWATAICEMLNYQIEPQKAYKYILAAEQDLSIMNKEDDGEYKLCDALVKFATKLNVYDSIDVDAGVFAKEACDLYYKIESEHLILDSKIVDNIKKYKSNGCKVICISDCEYDIDFYKKALAQFSIDVLFDDVYVSCEYKKSKRSGLLYRQFLENYNCSPKDCLMIGDNRHSDYEVPKSLGINTHFVKFPKRRYKTQNKKYFSQKGNFNILNNFFVKKDIAYCNYIFALYEFSDKLYKELIKNGQKHLFFFAREGQFLKRIFDEYQKAKKSKIETYYIEVSRASTFVPSLKPIKQEKFTTLFRQYSNINTENFLKSLNFDKSNIDKFVKKYGNDTINHFENSATFANLIADADFVKIYNDAICEQKLNFHKYLKSLCSNFDDMKIINVVDVGWKGTIQDNISNIFKDKQIVGYYIGLNQEGSLSLNNRKYGLLFNLNLGEKNIYNFEMFNWEYILKANHGKTVGYKFDGEKYLAVFSNDSDVECYDKFIKELQEKMFNYFVKLLDIHSKNYNFEYLTLNSHSLYKKMYGSMRYKDLKYMDNIKSLHAESFGIFGNSLMGQLTFKRRIKKYIKYKLVKWGLYRKY